MNNHVRVKVLMLTVTLLSHYCDSLVSKRDVKTVLPAKVQLAGSGDDTVSRVENDTHW